MEKKKDAKRTFTIAALVVWLVVSLIGTYFYIDFGGALGDSRIFLWLYAPVILFASRFAARREGAELNRLSQVIVTFGCGGLIYLMLVLGYNPLCEVWFWVIIIMLVFGCVVKILGLESMLHPPKGCDSAYVVILLYCSYLIAIVGLSVVMHPLSVSQIRVVGEAEGYQYIDGLRLRQDGTYLFADQDGNMYYYYDAVTGKIADHQTIGQLLDQFYEPMK